MVVIISRLFVVVVVVVATLPSSFVAFTKLRVVVIIFFWDECDDVLRSKEDSKKLVVAREFNKDDDFGTQQGDAFMLFAFITCESYARDESVTTRVEIRFLGKSLQKKKRQSFSAFEISSALEPSQLRRERRQKKQHQRQKQRQIRVVVFFIVLRVSRAFAARRRPRTRGEKTFRLRRKKISR